MAVINITPEELKSLIDLKDQRGGKVAEAWKILGDKGDAYAYLDSSVVLR